MKRTICLLLCCLAFSLTACGVSQADYDTLVEENSSLKTQVEELETKVDSLSSEKDTLESQVDSLSTENESLSATAKELLEYKTNVVLAEMDVAYEKAWATTSFGDNSLCIAGDSYFQCIAGKTYSVSKDGISELWSDLLKSVTTLGAVSENINSETISIKFFDTSGAYILEVTLKKNGSSCTLDTIMCNSLYADQIISILIGLSQ